MLMIGAPEERLNPNDCANALALSNGVISFEEEVEEGTGREGVEIGPAPTVDPSVSWSGVVEVEVEERLSVLDSVSPPMGPATSA